MTPTTIEGCACVVGRMFGPNSAWIVREPITGLDISNPSTTRRDAIADAARKINEAGGAEKFAEAIKAHTPANL